MIQILTFHLHSVDLSQDITTEKKLESTRTWVTPNTSTKKGPFMITVKSHGFLSWLIGTDDKPKSEKDKTYTDYSGESSGPPE